MSFLAGSDILALRSSCFCQPGPVGNGHPRVPIHSYVPMEGAELAFLAPSGSDLHDGDNGARGLRHEPAVRPDTARRPRI
jgi:hypothetical protein